MKSLLAAILAAAPALYSSSTIILPPPLIELERPITANTAEELFDHLKEHDDNRYCFRRETERRNAENRNAFATNPEIYEGRVACEALTMMPRDAADLVERADKIAQSIWNKKDLTQKVVDTMYSDAEYFLGWSSWEYNESYKHVLPAAREVAKHSGLDTIAPETSLLKRGYEILGGFREGTTFSDRRLVRNQMRELAQEIDGADTSTLEQKTAADLKQQLREKLINDYVNGTIYFANNSYEQAGYLEAWRFAQEMLAPSTDDSPLIDAAISRTRMLLPSAGTEGMRRYITEILDFATIVGTELPAEKRQADAIQGLREELRTSR